ncbi:malonate decarboxylase holo-[acyl-carrier-protein] synthase [Leptothrix discophora]|uniref:Malonate decarboxylase holo-[acyl-carrier-protein] synthase n=2 Tax=Leptothrix discophora TaxID=89 RepID=A0ABT9G1Q4_LEPDI|nr:malonate decarboxylase holo-[acyl-carrier-protein] synthase [Leptothrix discophora]
MPPLHRHQLVHLATEGWQRLAAQDWDDDGARACIDHWAAARLPLVVTRQCPEDPDGLSLGLPAPLRWQRRRLALRADWQHVLGFDEFPGVQDLGPLLPRSGRATWQRLVSALTGLDASARVYGSHGWQLLTGLPYLRDGSDIDLSLAVLDAHHADAVAAVLAGFCPILPRRLDGELQFPDGRAYAWREWQAWRAGRSRAILCKTLTAVSLEWRDRVDRVDPSRGVLATVAAPR